MISNNRIVCDLNKVQWARFFYRNQYGNIVNVKPTKPTVRALEFDPDEMHINGIETLISNAKRFNLLDHWTPEVKFQLTANHSLTYTGKKAVSLWKEWNRRMFNKK